VTHRLSTVSRGLRPATIRPVDRRARPADRTAGCSDRTNRRRLKKWAETGVAQQVHAVALAAYDLIIGLELEDVSVDGCITKAPCGGDKAGRSPVHRGKGGLKRSVATEAAGIPPGGDPLRHPVGQRAHVHARAIAPGALDIGGRSPVPDSTPAVSSPAATADRLPRDQVGPQHPGHGPRLDLAGPSTSTTQPGAGRLSACAGTNCPRPPRRTTRRPSPTAGLDAAAAVNVTQVVPSS
jgi:hypothetical protein